MRKRICTLLALTMALAVPMMAAQVAIEPGVDLFTTPPGGGFYDFARDPIPAGFFCPGSPAFDGRIEFRGLPLVTSVPGQLRGADTVVERLDTAVFDGRGLAETRIRMRALSMVGTEPLRTPCGDYQVYVTLAGKQGTTTMEIVRTSEEGGTFTAPLAIRGRMTFVPADGRQVRPISLIGDFSLPAAKAPWSFTAGPELKQVGPFTVDTDGDQVADTPLLGTSNFAPGWPPGGVGNHGACQVCEPEICHTDSGHEHCSGPIYACYPAHCP